jgi:transposase
VRFIGLDIHRDFCEVAISEGGKARLAGQISTAPEELGLFAESLGRDDRVVLEATGNALAIAHIIAPHVGEVVLAHAKHLRAISHAKVKTERYDARTLAELLAADLIPKVWIGDERTRVMRRRISRRRGLVKQATRAKNEIAAILHRNLKRRPPFSDPLGKAGRRWLAGQELLLDEREALDGALRQLEFTERELRGVDRAIAELALEWPEVRRLMTIPGVDVTTAATLMGAIGDISRFPTPRHLVGYLGLHPKVRQSGSAEARHGRTSKEGPAAARHVLVEAAWGAIKSPGPLRAFGERVRARRGKQVAAVAVARKLACLAWQLLTKEEDYAFARPALVRQKLRRLELRAGAPRLKPGPKRGKAVWSGADDPRDRELAERAEQAYRRLVADWTATGAGKKGAGATSGRAS